MQQRRWQRALTLGLAALMALAVLGGLNLTFEVEPQMQRQDSIVLHTTHKTLHLQEPNAVDNTPAVIPMTGCTLNGKMITGCSGTTTMGGQICTVSVDMKTHRISMNCHE